MGDGGQSSSVSLSCAEKKVSPSGPFGGGGDRVRFNVSMVEFFGSSVLLGREMCIGLPKGIDGGS